MAHYARKNYSDMADADFSKIYQSAHFYVYLGKYTTGKRAGEQCVCKVFKSDKENYERAYFEKELEIVAKTQKIVDEFNSARIIDKKIWLNEPQIWKLTESNRPGELGLVEPMIANFEKFNSNSGWNPSNPTYWTNAMQALSHFSYHSSKRELVLCDLQGGVYKNGFVITDPVIMSTTQGYYGPTDLGPKGISNFFSRHKCNSYCNKGWVVPHDKNQNFDAQQGTMMILPTRYTRSPLTCN